MHWHIFATSTSAMQSKLHLKKGYSVPRYYFDLTNGETTLIDEEGVDAANIDEAAAEAQVVLKDMQIGDELLDVDDDWTIVIRERDGETLREISLKSSGDRPSTH